MKKNVAGFDKILPVWPLSLWGSLRRSVWGGVSAHLQSRALRLLLPSLASDRSGRCSGSAPVRNRKRQTADLITDGFTSTIPVFRYYESGKLLVRRNFGGELRYQEVEFKGCELLPSLQYMA